MNTTELVAQIRSTGQLSANDDAFTAALLLGRATQALWDRFARALTSLRQGYWLHRATTSTTAGNALYRLPVRAIAQGVEKLEISLDGTNFKELEILTQTQATDASYTIAAQGQPWAFTLESDCVRLFPTPGGAYTLRFHYYLRPPVLTTYAATGIVAVVDVITRSIAVTSDPAALGITTDTGADIQHASGTHELSLVGGTITSIAGPVLGFYTITFAVGTDLSQVVFGDYIRVPDTAVFPMLPVELHRPLADYVAADALMSKGDKEKAGTIVGKCEAGIEGFVDMSRPRVKNRPFTFKTRNTYLRRKFG